jgi:two-component system cell cycle response regulator DivK
MCSAKRAKASRPTKNFDAMTATRNRVLVVEDNDDWRSLLALFIQRLGYEVSEATTGLEAIERATAVHPDLILMDLGLPGMSGDEATAHLKAQPSTRDIPVVVQTAYTTGEHTHRALETGAAEVLYKPIDLMTLREVLRKYLSAGTRQRWIAEPKNLSTGRLSL